MFDQNDYDNNQYKPDNEIQAASVDHNKIVSEMKVTDGGEMLMPKKKLVSSILWDKASLSASCNGESSILDAPG